MNNVAIFIDSSEQHPDVPTQEYAYITCPITACDPRSNWTSEYGLAGGGMGVYTYCKLCNKVIGKTQDKEQCE